MEQITEHIRTPMYRSRRFGEYFDGLTLAVADIETTGLSPETSRLILGGALYPQGDGQRIRQYFAESRDEEKALLQAYASDLFQADVLITYNGHRFDLPFMRRRLSACGLTRRVPGFQSLDLYRVFRYYSELSRFLPNLKQKTVEVFLGLSSSRKDEISGGESVALYRTYCRTGDPALREKILLHNRDDVVQLSQLLRMFDKVDLHRILYHEGFTAAQGNKRVYIKSISFEGNRLVVKGVSRNLSMDYYAFETGYQAFHLAGQSRFLLEVPIEERATYEFLDLEALPMDFPFAEELAGYHSGFLLLRKEGEPYYREINLTVRKVICELLKFIE